MLQCTFIANFNFQVHSTYKCWAHWTCQFLGRCHFFIVHCLQTKGRGWWIIRNKVPFDLLSKSVKSFYIRSLNFQSYKQIPSKCRKNSVGIGIRSYERAKFYCQESWQCHKKKAKKKLGYKILPCQQVGMVSHRLRMRSLLLRIQYIFLWSFCQ